MEVYRGLEMRQLAVSEVPWAQTMWISECGVLVHRHYDIVRDCWEWDERCRPLVTDSRGRAGHYIRGHFRTLEMCIAMAWLARRARATRSSRLRMKDASKGAVAHNLEWSDGDCAGDEVWLDDEDWRPVNVKAGIIPCRTDLLISASGRIRRGSCVSEGVYSLGPERFFPIGHIGLLPLLQLSHLMFTGERREARIPPRIRRAMKLIRAGASVSGVSKQMCVKENTAWSYVFLALQNMSTRSAAAYTARLVVTKDLEAVARKVSEETPLFLCGRLRDAMQVVNRALASSPHWKTNPNRYAELCLVRTLLQRERT